MTRAEAKIAGSLAILAAQIGGRITTGASLHGTVLVDDGALEVEITMVVRPKPTRDARDAHLDEALRLLVLEPYRDRCSCYVKRRDRWAISGRRRECKHRPTHVLVTKASGVIAGGPTHYYHMLCKTHAKSERGAFVAVVEIPAGKLEWARFEIKQRAELRERLEKMTPAQRVAEDAKQSGRAALIPAILATGSEP